MQRLVLYLMFFLICLMNFVACSSGEENVAEAIIDANVRPIDIMIHAFRNNHIKSENIIKADLANSLDGGKELNIEVRSERNRFHQHLVVALWAAGKVVARTPAEVKRVNVVLVIRYKEDSYLLAYTSGDAVKKFAKGQISADDLISKEVKWQDL